MHIIIEKNGEKYEELKFESGPVYIGRQIGSKIFLPDLGISRRHAVLYNQQQDEWLIQDLDSSNKTYVNGEEIDKCKLSDGDVVTVCDYKLKIHIDKKNKNIDPSIHLEDTIAHTHYELKTITRKLTNDDSPLVRISHQRVEQLRTFLAGLLGFSELEPMLEFCVKQILRQMHGGHCWVGIFEQETSSVWQCYGRNIDTTRLKFEAIPLKDQITNAINNNEHILVPRISQPLGQNKNLRSAVITSFKLKNGKSGAAYIDNTKEHEHYTIVDLDYLMLISTIIAAKIDSML